MNEEDIRELVREAIERHQRHSGGKPLFSPEAGGFRETSHVLLNVVPGSQLDDGMCLIEPAVRCNHCGFCQSYGH